MTFFCHAVSQSKKFYTHEYDALDRLHCKKYLGVVPRFTKKKVALSLPLHTLAVSFGNVLVAFGSVW